MWPFKDKIKKNTSYTLEGSKAIIDLSFSGITDKKEKLKTCIYILESLGVKNYQYYSLHGDNKIFYDGMKKSYNAAKRILKSYESKHTEEK
jgi:hypothetical protein